VDSFGISGQFLNQYDFSGTHARLITSIPGVHEKHQLNKYGHLRLRSVVRQLKAENHYPEKVTIHYQSSSMGSIRENWAREFLESATGKHNDSPPQPNRRNEPTHSADDIAELKLNFPSQKMVLESIFPQGAGLLHFSQRSYQGNQFLKDHMCLWKPTEAQRTAIPHSKILCSSTEEGTNVNWIYIGSHNFSQAAWGKLSAKKLAISNYEAGVLLPAADYRITPNNIPLQLGAPHYKSQSSQTPYFSRS